MLGGAGHASGPDGASQPESDVMNAIRSRTRRGLVTVAAALLCSLAPTTGALAHGGGDPHFESVVRQAPAGAGIKIQVLNRDDRLLLINRGGKDVTIQGYDGEPYARVLANGAVEVNTNSPAYYLNDDRYGHVKVPANADAKAPPRWKVEDRTGRFEWHDHRIHWMVKTTPPQVHDEHRKTKIFDWAVPVSVGGTGTKIAGTLYWAPLSAGAPAGLLLGSLAVLVVLGILIVVIRRRRLGDAPAASSGEAKEAW
jgi:hypothetical protein